MVLFSVACCSWTSQVFLLSLCAGVPVVRHACPPSPPLSASMRRPMSCSGVGSTSTSVLSAVVDTEFAFFMLRGSSCSCGRWASLVLLWHGSSLSCAGAPPHQAFRVRRLHLCNHGLVAVQCQKISNETGNTIMQFAACWFFGQQ